MLRFSVFLACFVVTLVNWLCLDIVYACLYPSKCERSFNAITYSLFKEGLIPAGDVLDVGAHDGSWACMYACFDKSRPVHAVDPSPKMIRKMRCPHSNFLKHNYAVSNSSGFMKFTEAGAGFSEVQSHDTKSDGDVPIQTLDYLFLEEWKSVPGFLHIDVEGFELQVLQGAPSIINKYQPVFTIEIHVVENKEFTVELIGYARAFGYNIYMVNEVCGMRVDCRNFFCFPPNLNTTLHGIHPMLDIAVRSETMIKVDEKDIFNVFERTQPRAMKWFDSTVFHVHPK